MVESWFSGPDDRDSIDEADMLILHDEGNMFALALEAVSARLEAYRMSTPSFQQTSELSTKNHCADLQHVDETAPSTMSSMYEPVRRVNSSKPPILFKKRMELKTANKSGKRNPKQ
jgi:hypothetical protein